MKEPWIRGAPEVEVHIHGPNTTAAPTSYNDRACAGEHSPDSRYVFDQNDGFWSGRVMIYHPDSLAALPGMTYNIIFWEDDNDSCTIKLDSNVLINYLFMAWQVGVKVGFMLARDVPWPVQAVAIIGTIYNNAGQWMLTDDDYIGLARLSVPEYPFYYPDNTHVLIDENGNLNGRANIYWH